MEDIIYEIQDLKYLNWARVRKSSGTAGSFLKAYDDSMSIKKYYKLSDYNEREGVEGHECVNEIIAQRILSHLGFDHLKYRLINAKILVDGRELTTFVCESEDFKRSGESKISFEDYYELWRNEREYALDFCRRMGFEKSAYQALTIDFLILNRDRHGANFEVLRSRDNKSVTPAPLFDHGLSFLCRCHTAEEAAAFDVMEDRKVQSFLGGSSAKDNLSLVPVEFLRDLPPVTDGDIAMFTEGLEGILDNTFLLKIQEMIRRRWDYVESIRNS